MDITITLNPTVTIVALTLSTVIVISLIIRTGGLADLRHVTTLIRTLLRADPTKDRVNRR